MPELAPRDFVLDNTLTVNQEKPMFLVYWRDSPSTQTELLSTKDEQVQELIHQIRKSFSISNHESLANKLIALFNIAKEEKPTSLGIAVDSLSNFYNFLKLYTNVKNPTLSLSPDYNIYASWRTEKQLFSAHFLPTGDIRFVLFMPNNRDSKRKIRITGIATSDTLIGIFASERLNDLVFNEG